MKISKKTHYALKAVYELAIRDSSEVVKSQQIADSQGISKRFLECILSDLKKTGIVSSKRGSDGGYFLAKRAEDIKLKDVIECFEPGLFELGLDDSDVFAQGYVAKPGDQAFLRFWKDIDIVLAEISSKYTIADMIDIDIEQKRRSMLNYSI